MGFDRDKAREVLLDSALGTDLGIVLDGLAECVTKDPWNLVQGRWFLGTEALPNQGELDAAEYALESSEREVADLEQRLIEVQSKLAQIRALCDEAVEWQEVDPPMVLVQDVRTILDAAPVNATPPQGRKVGTEFTPGHSMNVVERTTPPQGIDRDALARALWSLVEHVDAGKWTNETVERTRDEILVLVRPVEGIVLNAEEARLASWAVQMLPGRRTEPFRALVARLRASA